MLLFLEFVVCDWTNQIVTLDSFHLYARILQFHSGALYSIISCTRHQRGSKFDHVKGHTPGFMPINLIFRVEELKAKSSYEPRGPSGHLQFQ